MIKKLCVSLAALVLLPAATPPADPFTAFGAREGVEHISLSPSGNRIAFIAPGPGQSNALYVADAVGGGNAQKVAGADGDPERLTSCRWVSEQRLVCSIYMLLNQAGRLFPVSRIVALDSNGQNVRVLSRAQRPDDAYSALSGGAIIDWMPGEDGAVLMGREYVPEQRQGTHLEDKREGFGVDRIDTKDGGGRSVEEPKRDAIEYISDGRGVIRIMGTRSVAGATGYDSGIINYYYRKKGGRDWQQLGIYNVATGEGFNPYAVDPDLDIAYGFRKLNGRQALYSLALDGSRRETPVFTHPQVDVSSVVRLGRRSRVVGATFVTDRRQAAYFDPELQTLASSLSRALPGLPLIRFIDSSIDENRLLMWAGSDTDPGRYFVFDKPGKKLHEIMLARPQMEGASLAQVKSITYKAADGTDVPAYLTLPAGGNGRNLPAIVMPHGGPSSRDEWGFDWFAQFYAARGYAVLQPNYRGSSGYGDGWFQRNGFQSWRTAIGDVNDAGRWLIAQGIADPSKLAIVGWSYGGYAALQSGVLDPGLFKAVVAVAPVADLPQLTRESEGWSHHRLVRQFVGSGPHLREGSPAQNAERIQAPVLLFHGDRDFNVNVQQSRLMQDRLKSAGRQSELIVYPKLDHSLEDSTARTDMLRRSDAFLRTALKL